MSLPSSSSTRSSNPTLAKLYLLLLSLQFGLQPTLNARYTPKDSNKTVTLVIQESTKVVLAAGMLASSMSRKEVRNRHHPHP